MYNNIVTKLKLGVKNMTDKNYSADDIRVLSDREHVR